MVTKEFNEALRNRERYVDTTCYEALRRIEDQERAERYKEMECRREAEYLKRNPHRTRVWRKRK